MESALELARAVAGGSDIGDGLRLLANFGGRRFDFERIRVSNPTASTTASRDS
jgi:hypothetical protein